MKPVDAFVSVLGLGKNWPPPRNFGVSGVQKYSEPRFRDVLVSTHVRNGRYLSSQVAQTTDHKSSFKRDELPYVPGSAIPLLCPLRLPIIA